MGLRAKMLRVGGMTCVSCQNRIEKKLNDTAGVKKAAVNYGLGTAAITYDTDIVSSKDITTVIEMLGYTVISDDRPQASGNRRAIGILIIIFALYLLMRQFGNILVPSRLADAGMGYGMLFVIGLLTSVHCVAMCGGINLSQCVPKSEGENRASVLRPSVLYNLGRVISYTAVGFAVGALGSVITFTNTAQGVLKLVAGVFMVVMGVNMLGIFPWLRRFTPHMPKIFARGINQRKSKSGSPLIVGMLNGLMPCGPLQAMQIYALSTGNPFAGALSMFLFSLGTTPLMFGLGALSSVLSKKFTHKVMTAGAALVAALGLAMFAQGWNLSGLSLPSFPSFATTSATQKGAVNVENGVQLINSTLAPGRYPDITVLAGTPVKWTIDAPKGSVNGCNGRMFMQEFDIEHQFKTGENVIEFTPAKTGKFPYTCWMGMINGSISVVEPRVEPET